MIAQGSVEDSPWVKWMRSALLGTAALLPFPFMVLPHPGVWLVVILERCYPRVGMVSAMQSDSLSMAVLVIAGLVIALVITAVLHRWYYGSRLAHLARLGDGLLLSYLIIMLGIYGWQKIALNQFASPALHTLFTPIGSFEPDMLYWTAIGSAPAYGIFLGCIELGLALALLFSALRSLALLLSVGLLTHIVVLDLCYGIDVVLLSALLLCIALFLLRNSIRDWMSSLQKTRSISLRFQSKTKHSSNRILWLVATIAMLGLELSAYPAKWTKTTREAKGYTLVTLYNGDAPTRVFVADENLIVFQDESLSIKGFRYIMQSKPSSYYLPDCNGSLTIQLSDEAPVSIRLSSSDSQWAGLYHEITAADLGPPNPYP